MPAAILFAACLNFLLVARFIYPEWLIPSLVRIACWVAVAVWISLVVRQMGQLPALLQPRSVADTPDPFPQARDLFLQAQWAEAEAKLAHCLEIDPRDCQALLMLAAVYRHTERFAAAQHALDMLRRLETADHWGLECQTEQRKLDRAQREDVETHTKDPDGGNESGSSEAAAEETSRAAESAA